MDTTSDESTLTPDLPTGEVEGFSKRRVELVQTAVRDWVRQLIDLGGRNNLLAYRDLRAGTLDLGRASERALSSLLQGRAVRTAALFPDVEERAGALRRIRAIHKKARENSEERGIETLSMACGLASWENKRGSWQPSSPVLLRRAALRPLGAAQDEFELSLVDEMEVNETLLHLLKEDFDCVCDQEKLLDRIDGSIDEPWELEAAYQWLREHTTCVPAFDVTPRLILANFAYAKLPMVRDLQGSFDELVAHELIAAIAGDEDAKEAIRAQMPGPDAVPSPDAIPLADEFLTLDADMSQNYAINTALGGGSLIIKGPPGTGKSQTIANLIGSLVARRKRVLFVAEKRAAIDAVLKRLNQQQLGDLVLDLHGGAGSRRAFANAVAQALASTRTAPRADHTQEQRRAERSRQALNDYEHAVHDPRDPWDVSVYDARAELLGIPDTARAQTRFDGSVLADLGADAQVTVAEQLSDLARLGAFSLSPAMNPWFGASISSSEEVLQARELLDRIVRQTLPTVTARLEAAAIETSLPLGQTAAAWNAHLGLWPRAREISSFFTPAIYQQDLDGLCQDLAPAASGFSRLSASLFSGRFKKARADARSSLVSPGQPDRAVLDQATKARELLSDWRSLSRNASAPSVPADLDGLIASHAQLLAELAQLGSLIARSEFALVPLVDLRAMLDQLVEDQPTLVKLPEIHRLRAALLALGLGEFLAEVTARSLDEDTAILAFRDALLRSLLDQLSASEISIGAFDGDAHDRVVSDYIDADHAHIETAAQRIRRIAAETATAARDEHREQNEILEHQSRLRTRHRPVRELVNNTSDVLLALKPCWAMSPLVVSQLLPAKQYFDVVIFDEASQITPADAVSSILRGRQLVVAGDERQLPPTAFFVSEAPEDEEEDEIEDASLLAAGTRGFESILDALGALLPFRMLRWHYRSRDERLIAFSNAHIYDRMLTTFPGVGGAPCLRFVEAPWEAGAESNSPTAEVEAVVDLIMEHAAARPDESLGVIAMGIKHAQRIDETLRQRLRDDPTYEAFFAEDREEPFFVKNLERVQGDERDAIILSVGYGKNPNGQLYYRFGPINLEGGERRLNVAVTRAKVSMTLVASFNARDMDPEKLRAQGAQLLRQYFQYVQSDGSNLGDQVLEKPPLNPFEVDVRDTLAKRGLQLVPQYGCSGYWIDFAVKHPTQPGRYVLALECDGATYHSSESARDRDRLRQEQLERLGWCFHRIWSSEWFYRKDVAVEKVLAAYRRCLEEPNTHEDKPTQRHTEILSQAREASSPSKGRIGHRPAVPRGYPISDYEMRDLVRLIIWIESDDQLRTKDELLTETMAELGFDRRGKRIVERLTVAIDRARRERR